MSDLIKREDAVEAVYKALRTPLPDYRNDFFHDSMSYAIKIVNNIPSAELERKKGEWVYDGIQGRFPACKCSICGHYENADWAILQGANFCPHCGADMRGE